MKFIIDAQLPIKLKFWLIEYGVQAVHTLDLPKKNKTDDIDIIKLAARDTLIVISKDSDFIQYRIVKGIPDRLLIISTGNIVNKRLIKIFEDNFPQIKELFEKGYKVIEVDNTSITVHE